MSLEVITTIVLPLILLITTFWVAFKLGSNFVFKLKEIPIEDAKRPKRRSD